jgi:hypothetical protein
MPLIPPESHSKKKLLRGIRNGFRFQGVALKLSQISPVSNDPHALPRAPRGMEQK